MAIALPIAQLNDAKSQNMQLFTSEDDTHKSDFDDRTGNAVKSNHNVNINSGQSVDKNAILEQG